MAPTVTTDCTIINNSGQILVLGFSNYEIAARTIQNTQTATFKLTMPANYLNGALVYEVGHCLKWIIFWTFDDQVSTKMFKFDDPIDWKKVADNLKYNNKSEDWIICDHSEYKAWASIEPNSEGKVLTANIYASPVRK